MLTHDSQYFRSERIDVLQILKKLSCLGAVGAGSIGGAPFTSRLRRPVNRVAGGAIAVEPDVPDHGV